MSAKIDLKIKTEKIDGWRMHALEFANDKPVIKIVVRQQLANIQTKPGRKKRLPLQQEIAQSIKSERKILRDKDSYFVISLGMRFLPSHDNQKQPMDVDNYIKPIFAGIAAGLFLNAEEIPTSLNEFKDYDDSHFVYLYVERLDDPIKEEGVSIVISEK